MSRIVEFVWSRREDMLYFAAALLISLLLFIELQSGFEPGKEREFEVQLTFANQSDDLTVLKAARSIRVVASGSQQVLDALDTSKVRAVADLAGAAAGIGRFHVEVIGPNRQGLTLTAVRALAEVELEPKSRKSLDVQLMTVGTAPGAFTYTGATVLPATVEVSGPESVVPAVVSVRAVLDLSVLTPNQTVQIELEALGEANKPVALVTLSPSAVQVLPAVSIGPSRRNLLVTPVFHGQPDVGYRVAGYSVTPNQVETAGQSADVSRVTTVDTEPVRLEGLRSTRSFRVRLVLPPGVASMSGDEVTVIVRILRD